jgi:hypothetical protein
MNSSIFSNTSYTDGKIGIGRIPYYLLSDISILSAYYYNTIPDKTKTTHHTYFRDIDPIMYSVFDKIQRDPFWRLCENPSCIQFPVTQMNELYFSNPKPNFERMNLYGAAANFIPHRDCILYNFNGIRFYRIIIGLTANNNDTSTEFVNLNLEHRINLGDYMIFDFDKTLHRVKKIGQQFTSRILIKLHFIVCENCKYSENYVMFISNFYKYYYFIARYTEQIGTDPTTFIGFFFGLIWEWPFYPAFKYITFLLFIKTIIILNRIYKIKVESKNIGKLLLYSSSSMFMLYLFIVSSYYLRHIIT